MGRGRKTYFKGVEKSSRKVENNSIELLSKDQKQILIYLTEEFKTIKEIANIRNTSDKAVYKIIKKLKDKGYIKGVEKSNIIKGVGKSFQPASKEIYRLHALGFKLNIIDSSPKYLNLLKIRNKDELDNNSMMLYDDFILIYLNKDFFGDNPDICYQRSLEYINRFIVMIENNYKIILKKGKQYNLKQFRGEIAKTNDPYAKKCLLEKEKIKIYDDNGKVRLLVDNSFNLSELEAVNNNHHKEDMENINKKWLDLIKTDLMLSDVENHLKVQQHINMVTNERFDKVLSAIEQITNIIKEK